MQSSRLKNIIILILALVNLFLLASLFSRFSARRESREQTTTQLTELFAANGMTLSPDAVSFQPPPTGGTLARDTAQDRQMASLLLGDGLSYSDQGGGIWSYDSPDGAAVFRSGGSFEVTGRLGSGDVTLPLAASVTEAMHKAVEEQGHKGTFHGYIPSEQGYEFLREAIRKYYAGHGVELDMSEIFISDGAKSDLGNLLDLFSQDNTILVPDPVYPVYVDDNVMAGRKILYLPATAENGFLPMPEEAPHADIVYICSPNNPTGATYSVEQLKA